jgi:hypothetical protein
VPGEAVCGQGDPARSHSVPFSLHGRVRADASGDEVDMSNEEIGATAEAQDEVITTHLSDGRQIPVGDDRSVAIFWYEDRQGGLPIKSGLYLRYINKTAKLEFRLSLEAAWATAQLIEEKLSQPGEGGKRE